MQCALRVEYWLCYCDFGFAGFPGSSDAIAVDILLMKMGWSPRLKECDERPAMEHSCLGSSG